MASFVGGTEVPFESMGHRKGVRVVMAKDRTHVVSKRGRSSELFIIIIIVGGGGGEERVSFLKVDGREGEKGVWGERYGKG